MDILFLFFHLHFTICEKLKFTFESNKKGYTSISFLTYTPRNSSNSKRKQENKKYTNNAKNKLLSILNNYGRNDQWRCLLGLSLHTMQDYFAHVIKVDVYQTLNNYYGRKGATSLKIMYSVPIFKVDNEIIGLKNEDIEDNTAFLKWRINTTYSLTATYASCWKKNLYIKNLSAHARNEIYTERVSYQKMTYNSKKHKYDVDKLRYYVIYSNRYYISITTGK